jgi:hypothetical protein
MFGRVVTTIAVLAAVALIAVAIVWLIGSAVRGQRIEHRPVTDAAP